MRMGVTVGGWECPLPPELSFRQSKAGTVRLIPLRGSSQVDNFLKLSPLPRRHPLLFKPPLNSRFHFADPLRVSLRDSRREHLDVLQIVEFHSSGACPEPIRHPSPHTDKKNYSDDEKVLSLGVMHDQAIGWKPWVSRTEKKSCNGAERLIGT